MKRFSWILLLFFLILPPPATSETLPIGFGKTTWGMTKEELLTIYQIEITHPKTAEASGNWAVIGPAPGEVTVSGTALGEEEIRSVSFGFHPKWGLSVIHVRFADTNAPREMEKLLPKWTASYGPPKEQLPDPKVIWEDTTTHIELTYHVVTPRHPSPSDHMALVLWSILLMDRIGKEGGTAHVPDVDKLQSMEVPHTEK